MAENRIDKTGSPQYSGFHTAEVFVRRDQKLHTVPVTGENRPRLTAALQQKWQASLDLLVETLGASAGLIMQIEHGGIRVFLRSGDPGEAYAGSAFFPFGTGTYCENALGEGGFLTADTADWPCGTVGESVRCYCGIPLHWEDGSFFGTLCILDKNKLLEVNRVQPLVAQFGAAMESDLELLCLRQLGSGTYEKYARAMEALLQYSPGGIFSYSAEADEQFSFISENMLAFLGYTKEEFVRKFDNRFSLMVYEEDRRRILREIEEQIGRGPFDNCEYRIEKKDGSLVWVHDEGHIVADENGRRWFYVVIVDITGTIMTQQREREKFHKSIQSLLAANPEAVGTLQLNLSQNLCGEGHGLSQAVLRVMDVTTADGYFSNIASVIIDPEQRKNFLKVFDRRALVAGFLAGKTNASFEYVRLNDSGRPIWVRLYLNLLGNPDTGDVEGVSYSVDISREKRRDEIMHIITNQEYDLIALLHLQARRVEAYFLGDTLPKTIRRYLPAPGAACGLDEFHTAAETIWTHPDDREKYRLCSDPDYFRPLMDKNGHFEFVLRQKFPDAPDREIYRKFQHYYLGSSRDTVLVIESDVTQLYSRQKQELDKAKAEAQRVKDILDSITSGICVLHMPDPYHLTIEYVNQQMFRLLGFEPSGNDVSNMTSAADDLVMQYTADAFTGVHPDDLERVKAVFRDNYNSQFFVVDNYRTMGSGGTYHWIKEEVRLREVTPDCRVFYATYHDVSEEVRLNGELTAQLEAEKQLRREATAASAAKSDFLSRMSHDIRTPLNGIIGMTYLAQEEKNTPRTADCLRKIDTSSKFLLGLINDVLDMSRVESNKVVLTPEPYPIEEFNDYLDAVVRPLCDEKGQHFVLDEDSRLEGYVPLADKLRTNQVMFNLLSNAVKYTPEGGTIAYRVVTRMSSPGRIAVDHVISDNGIGMSDEFQNVLFEPFSQEARNDNSETRGTGLGLAIVKKLVDLMGGTIAVESKIGRGTTFRIHLEFDAVPAAPGQAGPAGQTAQNSACSSGELQGRHVLLCEDHPLNQEIVKTLLEQWGATAEVAINGKRGVDLFAISPRNYYDIVLMDVRMPVMDGLEATRAIRALGRADAAAVLIVAMTADAFADDVQKCLDAGMNAHLSKPIDPELMRQTLCCQLAQRA